MGSLEELLRNVAGNPVTWGAIVLVVTAIVKKLLPTLQDDTAKAASVVVAAVCALLATLVLPHVGSIPPAVNANWWLITWALSQLWFIVAKWLGLPVSTSRKK
jgi:hypothetical protein